MCQRRERTQCAACLDDAFDVDDKGPMTIMACDHWMHEACRTKHAEATAEREGSSIKEEYLLMLLGAPCPMGRTKWPFAHIFAAANPNVCILKS